MNSGWTYHDRIATADCGLSALEFYASHYRHSTTNDWLQRFADGQIRINGIATTPHAILQTGDILTWRRPPWQEPDVPLNYSILHEDPHLLAFSKPAGLPVMPGGGFVTHTLLHLLRQTSGYAAVTPLHRLGRGTSGVLLCAKTTLARRALAAAFRDSTANASPLIIRTYRALTGPTPLRMPEQITINTPIGLVPYPRLGKLHAASFNGKPSITRARILQRNEASTLWELELVTGRPHQIRIHLASIGCPLLGDHLYGPDGAPLATTAPALPGDGGYHLHAARLRFPHPATGAILTIEAPIPIALRRAQ